MVYMAVALKARTVLCQLRRHRSDIGGFANSNGPIFTVVGEAYGGLGEAPPGGVCRRFGAVNGIDLVQNVAYVGSHGSHADY